MHQYFITYFFKEARPKGFGTAEGFGSSVITLDKRIEDALKEDPQANRDLNKQLAEKSGYKNVVILWFKEL